MKYDTLVFIGRFQPVHNAHVQIISKAASLARELIIIVGSAEQPRTYKNPWTALERKMMLLNVLDTLDTGSCRITIKTVTDSMYNDMQWATKVQKIVSDSRCLIGSTAIIGYKKDESSFYLDMFPQWEQVLVEPFEQLDATSIRDIYFKESTNLKFITGVVPQPVKRLMEGWLGTPDYLNVIKEREFVEKYKLQFAHLPYPPIFVTVDAVTVCSGHVLMIKRKAFPGKGLWALPGGFVNANTDASLVKAMVRELKEETGLKVPPATVMSAKATVFDAINRSTRGRTITHAFLVDLGTQPELPKVKGMDDAEKAKWVPISEIDRSQCYEDHYEIITTLLGI